ncbi:MAG: hypothetical protein H8D23_03915 [Candidatus Brocadiales bacterium]|nr:hypothetical protein [Candidatus Brocadiales bacterium]
MSNKKKTSILIALILIIPVCLLITDKLTNKKISKLTGLFYLYFTSPKEVTFDKMLIKFPYNYINNIDNESLVLLKYPNRDTVIIFKKTKLSNAEDFFNDYTFRIEKLKFTTIKRNSKSINQNVFFILTAHKSSSSEYKEFVYIPSQQVIIEYLGKENSRIDLWNILQSSSWGSQFRQP